MVGISKRLSWRTLLIAGAALVGVSATAFISSKTSADDLPVTNLTGSIESNQTWEANHVYVINGYLEITDGVTVTVNAGAVIKFNNTSIYHGLLVQTGAKFNVNGTSSNPVVFTSLRDDSIGGDSAGDGPTTGSTGDYQRGVVVKNGEVSLDHVVVRYGQVGVDVSCTSNPAQISINDSMLQSGVKVSGCNQGIVSMLRNGFDVPSSMYALNISNGVPTGVALNGLNKNTFSGSDRSKVVRLYQTTVPANTAWTLSSDGGAVGVVDRYIGVEGSLSVDPGTVIKFTNANTYYGVSVTGGDFDVNGTSSNPVVFTSLQDDSIGGDSAGDGSTTGSATIITSL